MLTSLYVHIPFCLKRCTYCDFVSAIYTPGEEAVYIEALKKEILSIPDETVFSNLYTDGGTPIVLSTYVLADLITYIFKHLHFIDGYEATIESNRGALNKEKLQAIYAR